MTSCLERLASVSRGFLIGMTLAASGVFVGHANAAAPSGQLFVCTCAAPTCGNGATPGTQNQVYHRVPLLSLERMFAPAKTGAEKTGWECVSIADYIPSAPAVQAAAVPSQAPDSAKTAPAMAVAAPSDPKTIFSCQCQKPRCGGAGLMPGTQNERHESLSPGLVAARFQPGTATGWQCQNGLGAVFSAADAATPLDQNVRYACTCTQASCGGKDGIIDGERGQKHSGISAARVSPKYGPERYGEQATGWVCKPDGPAPKFTCACERSTCGGKDGVMEGEQGQRHSGIALARLQSSYGPDRSGEQATGWTCTQESLLPAPTALTQSPSAKAQGGTDSGYVCRCEGLLGCGVGGAPYGKKGEVRNNVPASLIVDSYHSDVPGGWVCSVAPGTVPHTVLGLPDPGSVCRCEGLAGCGSGGAPVGKKGEVRFGVPAIHIKRLFHADVPGGWVCSTQ